MTQRCGILIVGGGIAGLATAWHLGRRGRSDVVLLERETQLGAQATALNAAILRTLCEDVETSAMARAGAEFLRNPPAGFSDVPLLMANGLVLTAGPSQAETLRSWARAVGPVSGAEELSREQLRELAPHFDGKVELAYYFPTEGTIDVAALVAGFARGARRAGIELRTGASVTELLTRDGRVHGVRLEDGSTLAAEQTVLAAGAWAGRLGQAAGSRLELRPLRRHLLVTEPDPAVDPRWPALWSLEEGFYARPESGGLLLCACDESVVDPDDFGVEPEVLEAVAKKTAVSLPDFADAGAAHFWCGLRTFTEDGRFAIGRDPDLAGLTWVAGLGGHGISCGPEVGRVAAEALLAS